MFLFGLFFFLCLYCSTLETKLEAKDILYLQNYHPSKEFQKERERAKCYCTFHGYSYAFSDSSVLLKKIRSILDPPVVSSTLAPREYEGKLDINVFIPTSFDGRQVAQNTITMPRRWITIFQLLLSLGVSSHDLFFESFSEDYFDSNPAVRKRKIARNEWLVYSDLDCIINNSTQQITKLITGIVYEYPDCFFIAQDYHHIINSGMFIVKRSVESIQFLQLWLSQWLMFHDREWVGDQGYLQEAVLLYLHFTNPERFPYTPHSCREGKRAHQSNLCYASVLEEWGFPFTQSGRIMNGICLISPKDPRTPPFNRHDNPSGANDFFYHFTLKQNGPRDAPIWNDPICPIEL